MLHQKIKDQIKEFMLAKNPSRLAATRNLLAALTNDLVAKKRKPNEMLDDAAVLTVVRRLVKQRQDSIAQFRAGGRDDLVAEETAELEYLNEFLPPAISAEQITEVAKRKMTELALTGSSAAGKLTGAVMKELGPAADGQTVKTVIERLLN
ncbi:MAG: GatB/YqeY domain-containing protein [Patescibacteria group bacterium]